MDPLLISAASGMNARMESLDMLANNLANKSTVSFKSDRELNNLFQSQYPLVQSQWTDFSQGTLTPSGNPLDASLAGDGFFAVNTPTGVLYTRNGEFQISKPNPLQTPQLQTPQLQTREGYTLRNTRDQGKPIVVDPAQPIDIDTSGVVRQQGQEIGQIEVDLIDDPQNALKKMGTSYYALQSTSTPKPASDTEVRQGTLEQSNVPDSDQAVRLVSIMRQFEMLQRAMVVGTNMDKEAIEQVARVI
jgi:flagellar basal-body rod protein FlgF